MYALYNNSINAAAKAEHTQIYGYRKRRKSHKKAKAKARSIDGGKRRTVGSTGSLQCY